MCMRKHTLNALSGGWCSMSSTAPPWLGAKATVERAEANEAPENRMVAEAEASVEVWRV